MGISQMILTLGLVPLGSRSKHDRNIQTVNYDKELTCTRKMKYNKSVQHKPINKILIVVVVTLE